MGHYSEAREAREAEKRESRREMIRDHVRKEIEDMSLPELEVVKKVVDDTDKYRTLFGFLNTDRF